VDRLLDAALWPYGFYNEAASPITLLSTDMSLNRLAELHLTADSVDCWFRSHRSGLAMLEQVDVVQHPSYSPPIEARWGAAVWDVSLWSTDTTIWHTLRPASYYFRGIELRPDQGGTSLPDENGRVLLSLVYDADSLVGRNDLELVRNDIRLAKEGGTQQVARDDLSIGLYGEVTYQRNDLKTQNDANVLAIAQGIRDRSAHRVLRVEEVSFFGRPENLFGLMVIDIGDPVTVVLPNYLAVQGHVIGVRHDITPQSVEQPTWTTVLSLETYEGFIEPSVIGGDV
jgi:hypothetical protein